MNEKRVDLGSLLLLAVLGLCGYLARCLVTTQRETTTAISTATEKISEAATEQMRGMTTAFTTATADVTSRVTGLAEVLMLGRDSPSPSENSPTNSIEEENSPPPAVDLSALPETARWATEEEDSLLTTTPWQSSTPPDVSE